MMNLREQVLSNLSIVFPADVAENLTECVMHVAGEDLHKAGLMTELIIRRDGDRRRFAERVASEIRAMDGMGNP